MTSPLRKREVHKMKGLGYLEKLSLAAHWFLPREEAEDTIRDYRELLEDMGEKAFKRKFGGPVRAAVFSADKRKIWMWQGACGFLLLFGVFLALGFCFGINPFFEFPLFDWQALLPGLLAGDRVGAGQKLFKTGIHTIFLSADCFFCYRWFCCF